MTHSAVIVTRNRPRDLRVALDALIAQTRPPDEIVVVDSSERPFVPVPRDDEGPRIVVVAATPGIAAQRNAGLRRAAGEIISFFDDDAVPERTYCETILRRFEADAAGEIGGIGGSMITGRRRPLPERMFRTLFFLQRGNGSGSIRMSGFPDPCPSSDGERRVDVLPSTACTYRRDALSGLEFDEYRCSGAVLGLDTGRGFGEDMLLSARVAERWRLLVIPDARYAHHESSANREETAITQALYIYSLRFASRRFRKGPAGFALRAWALGGQALLNVLQAVRYGDAGYIRGFVRAMRAPLG